MGGLLPVTKWSVGAAPAIPASDKAAAMAPASRLAVKPLDIVFEVAHALRHIAVGLEEQPGPASLKIDGWRTLKRRRSG